MSGSSARATSWGRHGQAALAHGTLHGIRHGNRHGIRQGTPRRAALLLEVVIALTIMVAALGLLGSQIVAGLKLTAYVDEQTRASELGDRLLALLELDPAIQAQVYAERASDGDFGEQYRGWFWRVTAETIEGDIEGLSVVTLEVLHSPDLEHNESIDGAEVVRELHLLKADPGRIDLAEDFGVTEEQITQLMESVPLAEFDPYNLDPQALVSLDPQMLLELLPVLMPLLQQYLGAGAVGMLNPNAQGGMSPQDLQRLIEQGVAQGSLGIEPGEDVGGALQDLLDQQKEPGPGGGIIPPSRPGGGAGRGGAGSGGGRPPGRGGRGASGGPGSGTRQGEQPEYTIEDLMRMRDELEKKEGNRQ